MGRLPRIVLGFGAVLFGVSTLHLSLNQGGIARSLRRMTDRNAATVRGELLVGYLPVT